MQLKAVQSGSLPQLQGNQTNNLLATLSKAMQERRLKTKEDEQDTQDDGDWEDWE